MRRQSCTATGAFARGGFAWRLLWIALGMLLLVLPVLDLAWGEVGRHGEPCPLHANLVIPQTGVTPGGPLPSRSPVFLDPIGFTPNVAPSIFIPPRP